MIPGQESGIRVRGPATHSRAKKASGAKKTSMNTTAELRWMSEAEGGRSAPPDAGSRYSTLVRFSHETEEQRKKDGWSLIVELLEPANASRVQKCYVRFLSEDAPAEWLRPGARFALYEGSQKVADAVVLEWKADSSLRSE